MADKMVVMKAVEMDKTKAVNSAVQRDEQMAEHLVSMTAATKAAMKVEK